MTLAISLRFLPGPTFVYHQHDPSRYEEIDDRDGKQYFPSEIHQLIIPGSGKRRTKQDEQEDETECLENKPHRGRQEGRPEPSAEIERDGETRYQNDTHILTHEEHPELHAGVFGVKAGDDLAL